MKTTGQSKLNIYQVCINRTTEICLTADTAISSQKARYVDPMFVQCRPRVVGGGPILNRSWVNASCLLG